MTRIMRESRQSHSIGKHVEVKSILVLDGDQDSSWELKLSLEGSGYRVDWCNWPGNSQIAASNLADFDLVICDLDNGLGVWKLLLDWIRAQRLDTQLVLTSRQAAEREWLEALQLGVFDLLIKPYSRSEILRVTGNALTMNYNSRFKTA